MRSVKGKVGVDLYGKNRGGWVLAHVESEQVLETLTDELV